MLVGLSFGTAAAVLLAPRPGRHVRDSLSREAKRFAVRATGLHPEEWREISVEDNGRTVLENMNNIRNAGF
jgi:gas vesicle protein